jgi:hypothetical protein
MVTITMRKQEERSGGAAAAAAAAAVLPSSDEDLHGTSFCENEIEHLSLSLPRRKKTTNNRYGNNNEKIKDITRAERE